jgi:hypothetical protein
LLSSLLFALLTQAASGMPAQTTVIPVPFRILGVAGSELRIDIGAEKGRAASLRRATVLTRSGAVPATLVRTERICEWLCGEGNEDGKECHFEAVLRALRRVQDPVTVLPGRPNVQNITTPTRGRFQPVTDLDRWTEADPVRSEERTFRWVRFPDGVFLASDDMGREFYAPGIGLAECTARTIAPFTVLACPLVALLYEGARGIVASLPNDSQEATVDPLLRLRLDGRDAAIISLGLRAVTNALLIRNDDGGWRVHFLPFDYSMHC